LQFDLFGYLLSHQRNLFPKLQMLAAIIFAANEKIFSTVYFDFETIKQNTQQKIRFSFWHTDG